MDLDALAAYIADSGLGVVTGRDKTIFVYDMPEKVARGVLLKLPDDGVPIDHELPGYRKTGFQVIVRDNDYVKGMKAANDISTALNLSNTTVGTMSCRFIRPKHEPIVFPVSQGDTLEFSVNFDATYSLTG